jgi:molybdate transport system ATP-binding protein
MAETWGENMSQADHLFARLQLARKDFLLDVEFELRPDRICALFGPSGSGKTSILRALAGLERKASGEVIVNGNIWQNAHTNLPPHQRALGYVFQEASLLPHLTVQQNLEYGWKRNKPQSGVASASAQTARSDFAATVSWLGLQDMLERKPQQLSGGEQQRVALGRALLSRPQLLLMDEAISSLDAASKQEIVPWLKQVQQQWHIPMLYVTHAMDEVLQLADEVILLERGKIRAQRPLAEALTCLDLPFAHSLDAESLIVASVRACEERFLLVQLDSAFGPLSMVHPPLPPGQQVQLRIRARDVSITRHATPESSILNIFPVQIRQIELDHPGQVLLLLHAQSAPGAAHRHGQADTLLLARITAKSAHLLDLQVGQQVFAQIKGVALVK